MKFFRNKTVLLILFLLLFFFVSVGILVSNTPVLEPKIFGVTFSPFYAERFGLDWQMTYTDILDDLNVKNIRIVAYWDEIEKEEGEYDFSQIDWQVREAEDRDVNIIVAVGRKLPRWPECRVPGWAGSLGMAEQNEALLRYVSRTISHLKNSEAIKMWQIENEPFLSFGECPELSSRVLDAEISLVKTLDGRPIMITDSGELSIWIPAARRGDVFGSTMYRTVWSDRFGHFTYPLPPSFFRLKRSITEFFVGKKPMLVIELQGESWQKKMTYEVSVEEQYLSMNPEKFRGVLEYASYSGFDTFYLWGVEWWYWLKETQDRPEMWDIAKEAINDTNIRMFTNDINGY